VTIGGLCQQHAHAQQADGPHKVAQLYANLTHDKAGQLCCGETRLADDNLICDGTRHPPTYMQNAHMTPKAETTDGMPCLEGNQQQIG
jgi:hypothetical protein